MKPLFPTLLLNIVVAFGVSLLVYTANIQSVSHAILFSLSGAGDYCMQSYFGFRAVRRHKSKLARVA